MNKIFTQSLRVFADRNLACYSTQRIPIPLRRKKPPKPKKDEKVNYFVDWKQIKVFGGKGGDGQISTLSVYGNEFAGPDGGNGGFGGHVIFRASDMVSSLNHLKTVVNGENGDNGGSQCRDGKNGCHTIIDVPIGTIFRNANREVLVELAEKGSAFLASRGGEGGKGNAFFRSSSRQTPVCAEVGAMGESFFFEVELKTSAHVGLIGYPNAGKSTLIRAITRAAPKVAAYPFTTLNPHVGVVDYDDYERISIADIPGIIEGSHENKGLGIGFLRHIERCLCFLYIIDVSQPEPVKTLEILMKELDEYCEGLSKRPHKIVANKIDVEGSESNLHILREHFGEDRVLQISAKHGINLKNLLHGIRVMYDDHMASRKDKLKLKEI